MERAQTGVVLRPGFAQLDVVAHHADDVRLLLYRVCKIAGVGHEAQSPLSPKIAVEKLWKKRGLLGACGLLRGYARLGKRGRVPHMRIYFLGNWEMVQALALVMMGPKAR